jgi:hypothetical protein
MSNYEGHKAAFELPTNVYRLDPSTREATVVVSDMDKPNGICFSPDAKRLYIVDTGEPKHSGDPRPIRVYDVGWRAAEKQWMFVNRRPVHRMAFAAMWTAASGPPLDEAH